MFFDDDVFLLSVYAVLYVTFDVVFFVCLFRVCFYHRYHNSLSLSCWLSIDLFFGFFFHQKNNNNFRSDNFLFLGLICFEYVWKLLEYFRLFVMLFCFVLWNPKISIKNIECVLVLFFSIELNWICLCVYVVCVWTISLWIKKTLFDWSNFQRIFLYILFTTE